MAGSLHKAHALHQSTYTGLLNTVKEGWIKKRAVSAPEILKNWKSRFITVRSDCIEWRAGPRDFKLGSMPLTPQTTVSLVGDNKLSVKQGSATLVLEVEDAAECSAWCAAITDVANGKLQAVSGADAAAIFDEDADSETTEARLLAEENPTAGAP